MNGFDQYIQAVDAYLQNDKPSIDKFLHDETRSHAEHALIRARMKLKAGDYEMAHEILQSINPTESLLAGDAAFLRAALLSYKSQWQQAAVEAHVAIPQYLGCNYERGLFLSHYNLSVYYGRLGLDHLSTHFLALCEKWMKTANQKALVLRAKACEYSKNLKFAEAIKSMEEVLGLVDELDPVDKTAHQYVAADIYYRAGNSPRAMNILEDLSHSKVVRDKAKVKFELVVLRSLMDKSVLLVDQNMPDVIEESIEYRLSWKVLETLQRGDLATAKKFWGELVELLPQKFGRDFSCLNDSDLKAIFMTAVSKLLNSSPTKVAVNANLHGKSKELLEILQTSGLHLRKEELIERLWQTAYDPSYDNRFYKILSRLRKEGQVRVVVVANTYRLVG